MADDKQADISNHVPYYINIIAFEFPKGEFKGTMHLSKGEIPFYNYFQFYFDKNYDDSRELGSIGSIRELFVSDAQGNLEEIADSERIFFSAIRLMILNSIKLKKEHKIICPEYYTISLLAVQDIVDDMIKDYLFMPANAKYVI